MSDDPWNDDVTRRLIDLESRLSHHERMVEDLSDVVAHQAQTIDVLTAALQRLRQRLIEAEAALPASPQDEKPPPHY